MTTISPEQRAEDCVYELSERAQIIHFLQELWKIVEDNQVPRPPIAYLTRGVRALRTSDEVVDKTRHPKGAPQASKYGPAKQDKPSDAELKKFRAEMKQLIDRVLSDDPWHFNAYQMLIDLRALKDGRLIYPELTKDSAP